MVIGENGVLTQADEATIETRKASAEEDVELAWVSADSDYWTDWTDNSSVKRSDYYNVDTLQKYVEGKGKIKSVKPNAEGTEYTIKYESAADENVYTIKVDANGNAKVEGEGVHKSKVTEEPEVEPISLETNCEKYYVNIDETTEEPEGIIYIDKAKTVSGSWNGYSYTIENKTTGLKEYYISKENHTTKLGTAPVLSLVPGSTGEERFYVMALEDEKTDANTKFSWYNSGNITDYSTVTSTGIGAGKTNTENMITKWNAGAYGAKNDSDMWGLVKEGWYISSRAEWLAFASTFGVTSSNFGNLGLSGDYWSSSLQDSSYAKHIIFGLGSIGEFDIGGSSYVRLSTTF